ncbi:MAG: NfeD family protein [Alphaproteobacteria bacterium]
MRSANRIGNRHPGRYWLRLVWVCCLALATAGFLLGATAQETGGENGPAAAPGTKTDEGPQSAPPVTAAERGKAVILDVEGVIGPPMADYLIKGIADAQDEADLIILEMNTPGGLVKSTFEINEAILTSKVPVVTFVYPVGAQATSAGTYIMYASHLAAMAPSSTVGAATPVDLGAPPQPEDPDKPKDDSEKEPGEKQDDEGTGGAPKDAMSAKAINLLAAQMRSLAERHGRNAEWAEKAVREAATITASEAVEKNVANFIAGDIEEVLEKAHGKVVNIDGAGEVPVDSQDLEPVRDEMSWAQRLLVVISNPTIALILMQVGVLGIIVELYNPGAMLPGVAGVICLLMGLFSLGQLPIDLAAAALMAAGLLFIVLEAFFTSGGILALGGIAAFAFGALFLVDTDVPGMQISPWFIVASTAVFGALLLVAMSFTAASFRRRVQTGAEYLVGLRGEVVSWSGLEGTVLLDGERWQARSNTELEPGQPVVAVKLDGLVVTVKSV